MADLQHQSFKPFWGTLDAKVCKLAGRWPIGATGAVGTQVRGKGMTLTRTGVGAYRINLKHKGSDARPVAFQHANVSVWVNDADPTNDTDGHYVKMLAISDSAGTLTFQTQDEAGVVREAPNGAVITVEVTYTLSSSTS